MQPAAGDTRLELRVRAEAGNEALETTAQQWDEAFIHIKRRSRSVSGNTPPYKLQEEEDDLGDFREGQRLCQTPRRGREDESREKGLLVVALWCPASEQCRGGGGEGGRSSVGLGGEGEKGVPTALSWL